MRCWIVALALVAAACGQTSAPAAPGEDAALDTTSTVSVAAPGVTVDPIALGGQWGFDRTCGLYDLVFTRDGATYYDYSDPTAAVGYDGAWAIEGNRVTLDLQRLDAEGSPSGPPLIFVLNVAEDVTDNLVGDFGREGQATQAINARRCDQEDRE